MAGGAYGVEAAVNSAALVAGGDTIAVLAVGVVGYKVMVIIGFLLLLVDWVAFSVVCIIGSLPTASRNAWFGLRILSLMESDDAWIRRAAGQPCSTSGWDQSCSCRPWSSRCCSSTRRPFPSRVSDEFCHRGNCLDPCCHWRGVMSRQERLVNVGTGELTGTD